MLSFDPIRLMKYWPPFLAAGIRPEFISQDFCHVKVAMKLGFYNRNYVGTHYGGSLYSMTDPFYMLMLIRILGSDYLVWDKAATIRFKKPGKGKVTAEFKLDEIIIDEIKAEVEQNGKTEKNFLVQVKNEQGEVVSEVDKLLWIAKKRAKTKKPSKD